MNDATTLDAAPFVSILFAGQDADTVGETSQMPECFHDLNLDQIVTAITTGKEDYRLAPFFYATARSLDEVAYRQEVMQDLERHELMAAIGVFASSMKALRDQLTQREKLHYRYERERWLIGAISLYGAAVERLVQDLHRERPRSRGLCAWMGYLTQYVRSDGFAQRLSAARSLIDALSAIRYGLHINGRAITVRACEGEVDASEAIEKTFAKFSQGVSKTYLAHFSRGPGLDHIDAQILERVALLQPEVFLELETFGQENEQFQDETVNRFDREIQFYVAYLNHIDRFRARYLPFCYPRLSDTDKEVASLESFDLALANRLIRDNARVICNDFSLSDVERLLVVSGPNQGGKTTFARMFGQMHWLAALGCAVPGKEANLFFFDRLLTHFEKEEDISNLRGKLKDDLVRIHHILDQATDRSIVIINEIFASTTLDDAMFLGKKIMSRLSQLDVIGVCVTFLTDLASYGDMTVSMTSTLDPKDPTIRTFKVERRLADGLAYALAIAEKYRVTYDWLVRRIGI
ncbi:MutS-related protein [Dyella mobilis]|uniref:DNA mismatch repair protein MutS n=1 Tax=Dyella mobilis TaxID=1849582 RepID=A0ABS2KCV3_9GAMM|nr:hypothetical protein [Dyella mobilis]MBM7128698.1 DNA mismatch repair protein MutS [Dyella mobilis]GLQ99023.1 DNA mismatch repair protein MutS [Dyella mobilis]